MRGLENCYQAWFSNDDTDKTYTFHINVKPNGFAMILMTNSDIYTDPRPLTYSPTAISIRWAECTCVCTCVCGGGGGNNDTLLYEYRIAEVNVFPANENDYKTITSRMDEMTTKITETSRPVSKHKVLTAQYLRLIILSI